MRLRAPCLLLALFACTCAAPARSAVPWPDGHVAEIYNMGRYDETGMQFLPSAPGSFWTHETIRIDKSWHVMSRISNTGEFLTSAKSVNFYGYPTGGLAADALGSLFVLRAPPSGPGLELSGWNASGGSLPAVTVAPGNIQGQITGAAADGGGAWFLWPQLSGGGAPAGPRLLRVAADGTVASGWSAAGWRLASTGASTMTWNEDPLENICTRGLLADGHGGVLVMLVGFLPRVVRVSADTSFAAGWPAGGLVLSSNPAGAAFSSLVPSGPDHFIAVWFGGSGYAVCQRFALDGTLDPNWPADGLLLDITFPKVFSDGQDGVYFAYWSGNNRLLRHLLASGEFATGGLEVPAIVLSTDQYAELDVTTGRAGGFVVADWTPGVWDLRGRWYDGTGAPDPAPGSNTAVFLSLSDAMACGCGLTNAGKVGVHTDGERGVFLGWGGGKTGDPISYAHDYVTHKPYPGDALLDVAPSLSAGLAVRLVGAHPVAASARVHLSLPASGAATLMLCDVQGRAVRRWSAGAGAGERDLSLDGLGTLGAGLYWLRLEQGGRRATAKLAIVH